jgi:hypothetical protein
VSTVQADLRLKTRVDVRRTPTATGTAADLGAVFQTAMPSGETLMLVSGAAVRVEQSKERSRLILLFRPNEQIILDPQARTYTRVPQLRDALSAAAQLPPPTLLRTGEYQMVLGLRAERVEMAVIVPLPLAVPGFPTVVRMTGDLWVTDAHRAYGRTLQKIMPLPTSVPRVEIEGMVLRQTLRNAEVGIEISYEVTELIEGPIAPQLFDLPPGYRRQP